MTVKRLTLLPAGRCYVSQNMLNENLPEGKLVHLPVWSYLVETTDGPILIDTGMPDAYTTAEPAGKDSDPDTGPVDQGPIVPDFRSTEGIVPVLRRAGYDPRDLLCVVNSHWHFDHAGGNSHFPHTRIVVQKAEYDAAQQNPDDYPPECRLEGLHYDLIEGDHELLPGFQLLFTPGHSLGHMSVYLSTVQSGKILLTIDAAYTRANFDEGAKFAAADWSQAESSLHRLRELVHEERPRVFFGHDIEQEKEWFVYPNWY
jgi:N-acyl homoserine lactone hydrolase